MSDDKDKKPCNCNCFNREQRESILILVKLVPFLQWCKFSLKAFRAGTVFLGVIAGAIIAWQTIVPAIKENVMLWLS